VLDLLADVLVPAEDEEGIEAALGARLGSDLPFDHLVARIAGDLTEEL
jgi:hypothetical protein